MNSSRKALALFAVLALAGCGNNSPGPTTSTDSANKSPLAEYMGDGFSMDSSGGMTVRIGNGNQQPTEEDLNKQRQVEDSIVTCMQTAGFRYVAVPPESQPKAKFNDAFNLPPDKFAEQYGYGISTIDPAAPAADASNPNTPIRNALSAAAKKAYDKALNGAAGSDGRFVVGTKDGSAPPPPTDLGCRGKAAEAILGKGPGKGNDMQKYDSLFKDLEALQKRIQQDARVVAATQAWSDCLANAGKPGYRATGDTRKKVEQKLAALTGQQNGPGAGGSKVGPPPSFDKVDAVKLADLRKFEIDLAKADQKCRAKGYDAEYKKAQYDLEKEFVTEHKAELEQYRDGMAQR